MSLILITDKSFLEMINPAEALLVQKYFVTNITPVLLQEVVADLHEVPRSELTTAEKRVAQLAEKLPVVSLNTNAHHLDLVRHEIINAGLVRDPVPLTGQMVPSQKPKVATRGDKKGWALQPSRESLALQAWREQRFSDLDRLIGQQWKDIEKSVDVGVLAEQLGRSFKNLPKFQDAEAAKKFIDNQVMALSQGQAYSFFKNMLSHFGMPVEAQQKWLLRWKALCAREGRVIPPHILCPYAYYVFTVDLFFAVALSQRLVPSGKNSKSHIDLQYVYYLPFTNCFTSNDNFHKRVVPLFVRQDQLFLDGFEFKNSLKDAAAHLGALAPEISEKRNDNYPPQMDGSLLGTIYDKFTPSWRAREVAKQVRSKETDAKLLAELKVERNNIKPAQPGNMPADPDFIMIEHRLTREQMKRSFNITDAQFDEMVRAEEEEDRKG